MKLKDIKDIDAFIIKAKDIKIKVDTSIKEFQSMTKDRQEFYIRAIVAQNYIIKDELFEMIEEKKKEDKIFSWKSKVYFWPFSFLMIILSLFI